MWKKNTIIILITICILCLIFYKINLTEILITLKSFNFKYTGVIAILYILSLYLRGIRWKALLLNDSKYSALNLGEVFTVGSMLNIFLPARAGDLYRAYYLGKIKNEKKMKIFGSVILERILDGLVMLSILFIAVLLYFKKSWILNLCYAMSALFLGSLAFFVIILKYNRISWLENKLKLICKVLPENIKIKVETLISRICNMIAYFVEGFEVLNNGKLLSLAFILSIIIWLIECFMTYLVFLSFNLNICMAASLFVMGLTSFSTIIPSTSMFLGPYQYAYILALGIFGIDKSTTLAISTVHQGIIIIVLTVIGLWCLLKFNISIKQLRR